MANLNLPEILPKEAFKTLPAKEKEEYLNNLLKKVLELNSNGITISQIKEATEYTYSTVWHHLELLAAKGECLRIEQGDVDVYFCNKVLDTLKQFDFADKAYNLQFEYNFDLIENNFGKFLRIQRQRERRAHAHSIRAGVLIPYEMVDKLADILLKIKESHLNGDKEH